MGLYDDDDQNENLPPVECFFEHESHEFNESLHTLRLCWASG